MGPSSMGPAAAGQQPAWAGCPAAQPCVDTVPPLQPGEQMVLGEVLSAQVAALYDAAQAPVADNLVCKGNTLQVVAPAYPKRAVAAMERNLRKALGPDLRVGNLPADLEPDGLLAAFVVPPDDLRVDLRGMRGACTRTDVPAWHPLGCYRSRVMLRNDYRQYCLQPPDGWSQSKLDWRTHVDSYALDLQNKLPSKGKQRAQHGPTDHEHLVCSAVGFGNLLALANDPRLAPLRRASAAIPEPNQMVYKPNADCLEVRIGKWHFPVFFTTIDLAPATEIIYDYSPEYWSLLQDNIMNATAHHEDLQRAIAQQLAAHSGSAASGSIAEGASSHLRLPKAEAVVGVDKHSANIKLELLSEPAQRNSVLKVDLQDEEAPDQPPPGCASAPAPAGAPVAAPASVQRAAKWPAQPAAQSGQAESALALRAAVKEEPRAGDQGSQPPEAEAAMAAVVPPSEPASQGNVAQQLLCSWQGALASSGPAAVGALHVAASRTPAAAQLPQAAVSTASSTQAPASQGAAAQQDRPAATAGAQLEVQAGQPQTVRRRDPRLAAAAERLAGAQARSPSPAATQPAPPAAATSAPCASQAAQQPAGSQPALCATPGFVAAITAVAAKGPAAQLAEARRAQSGSPCLKRLSSTSSQAGGSASSLPALPGVPGASRMGSSALPAGPAAAPAAASAAAPALPPASASAPLCQDAGPWPPGLSPDKLQRAAEELHQRLAPLGASTRQASGATPLTAQQPLQASPQQSRPAGSGPPDPRRPQGHSMQRLAGWWSGESQGPAAPPATQLPSRPAPPAPATVQPPAGLSAARLPAAQRASLPAQQWAAGPHSSLSLPAAAQLAGVRQMPAPQQLSAQQSQVAAPSCTAATTPDAAGAPAPQPAGSDAHAAEVAPAQAAARPEAVAGSPAGPPAAPASLPPLPSMADSLVGLDLKQGRMTLPSLSWMAPASGTALVSLPLAAPRAAAPPLPAPAAPLPAQPAPLPEQPPPPPPRQVAAASQVSLGQPAPQPAGAAAQAVAPHLAPSQQQQAAPSHRPAEPAASLGYGCRQLHDRGPPQGQPPAQQQGRQSWHQANCYHCGEQYVAARHGSVTEWLVHHSRAVSDERGRLKGYACQFEQRAQGQHQPDGQAGMQPQPAAAALGPANSDAARVLRSLSLSGSQQAQQHLVSALMTLTQAEQLQQQQVHRQAAVPALDSLPAQDSWLQAGADTPGQQAMLAGGAAAAHTCVSAASHPAAWVASAPGGPRPAHTYAAQLDPAGCLSHVHRQSQPSLASPAVAALGPPPLPYQPYAHQQPPLPEAPPSLPDMDLEAAQPPLPPPQPPLPPSPPPDLPPLPPEPPPLPPDAPPPLPSGAGDTGATERAADLSAGRSRKRPQLAQRAASPPHQPTKRQAPGGFSRDSSLELPPHLMGSADATASAPADDTARRAPVPAAQLLRSTDAVVGAGGQEQAWSGSLTYGLRHVCRAAARPLGPLEWPAGAGGDALAGGALPETLDITRAGPLAAFQTDVCQVPTSAMALFELAPHPAAGRGERVEWRTMVLGYLASGARVGTCQLWHASPHELQGGPAGCGWQVWAVVPTQTVADFLQVSAGAADSMRSRGSLLLVAAPFWEGPLIHLGHLVSHIKCLGPASLFGLAPELVVKARLNPATLGADLCKRLESEAFAVSMAECAQQDDHAKKRYHGAAEDTAQRGRWLAAPQGEQQAGGAMLDLLLLPTQDLERRHIFQASFFAHPG